MSILSQRLDEVEAQNAQFVTDMIKRSEAQELMMRKIAELEDELLQVKTSQLSVQQAMQFNSAGYAQQPPMLEEGMFERLHYHNAALSQAAAAYSDMPQQQHQMHYEAEPDAIAHAYDDQQTQE